MNVDHTEDGSPVNVVEFCAGYAGIHLGLRRAIRNLRVIAFSEIEAFACANLVAKMEAGLLDPAPIWTNLKTFPGRAFRGKVGILVAGYPCQPFSAAGKRLGADDPRHLWPFVREQIALMQPEFCFFENVDGHISMGLSTVLSDLEEDGYRTTWGVFSAAEVGAPHQRKRVFILAQRRGLADPEGEALRGLPRRAGEFLSRSGFSGLDVAHNQRQRVQEHGGREPGGEELAAARDNGSPRFWPSRPGEPQHWWEPSRTFSGKTFSEVGRDSHGTPDRMDNAELFESCDSRVDELRLLGNGVVPATAERAWRVLYERLRREPKAHASGN